MFLPVDDKRGANSYLGTHSQFRQVDEKVFDRSRHFRPNATKTEWNKHEKNWFA